MTKILVAGATGTQGGAVVDHLLGGEYGTYDVYGLTRDANSERAQALAERGVTVVEGDLTDGERMAELCAGMDAVFCVTTFFEDGPAVETEQGITLADAASEAGVSHFVYSSVGGADRDTGLAHFESKYTVERHVADLGLPATIVRPVYFMQNLAYMHGEELRNGTLSMPLDEGVELGLVDADDIGRAVATAVADPERFVGQTFELGGDSLTLEAMADAVSTAMGTEIEPVHLDLDTYRDAAGNEMADMYAWFNAEGYDIDTESLRAEYGIETTDFASWLTASDAFRPAPAASR
ncbi:NmrA/HSCARG family protein [Salinirubrum litoreum]|uniref:NmrA/HSCARG family protein n=1 Tax=Salinirubrum litoreum TaxID=1126234 RepID=A0ABD5RDK3_9EURY|nr:NmrA/HSCARG family protein [Salinirubrum litoreum]